MIVGKSFWGGSFPSMPEGRQVQFGWALVEPYLFFFSFFRAELPQLDTNPIPSTFPRLSHPSIHPSRSPFLSSPARPLLNIALLRGQFVSSVSSVSSVFSVSSVSRWLAGGCGVSASGVPLSLQSDGTLAGRGVAFFCSTSGRNSILCSCFCLSKHLSKFHRWISNLSR